MTLISILVSLLIEKFFDSLQGLRKHTWYSDFYEWMRQHAGASRLWDGPLGVVLVIAPVLLGVGLLQYVFRDELFGLLSFVYAVAVLSFTLGVRDLEVDLEAYINARETQDEEAACRAAEQILGRELTSLDGSVDRAVANQVLIRANEQTFTILFWFLVLGPLGAALVRLAHMTRDLAPAEEGGTGFLEAAKRLNGTLTWLPARMTALGFAVTGSFEDAMRGWRDHAVEWSESWVDSAAGVVAAAGVGALGLDVARDEAAELDRDTELAGVRDVRGLLWRTLYFWWIALIAILTLLGWAA